MLRKLKDLVKERKEKQAKNMDNYIVLKVLGGDGKIYDVYVEKS